VSRLESPLRPRRRGWLLVAGLLAMVVCAGAFALVYLGADARVAALAVARPLAAGQAVAAADLRVVRIVPDAGVQVVPAGQVSQVVGRRAAVPLPVGTLLNDALLGPAGWPPEGQAVVAVPVKVGRLPAGVTPGRLVLVVALASDTAAGPPEAAEPSPVPAMVVDVAAAGDGSGTTVVTLLLARPEAVRIAAAGGEVTLVLAPGTAR
jgi:hypothetical protein